MKFTPTSKNCAIFEMCAGGPMGNRKNHFAKKMKQSSNMQNDPRHVWVVFSMLGGISIRKSFATKPEKAPII